MDYETAALASAAEAFPAAQVHGCFFHLSQCILRNMSNTLKKQIGESLETELQVKSLLALAFCPPEDVRIIFHLLYTGFPRESEIRNLGNYFRETWVGSQTSSPRYPIHLWSVYSRVIRKDPRTTNSVEGWNHRMSSVVNCAHPSLFKFIEILKAEQQRTEGLQERRLAGEKPRRTDVRYIDLNERLLNLVRDYKNRDQLDYVRGIAHNLSAMTRQKRGPKRRVGFNVEEPETQEL
jgi:hypothetical protein